MAPSFLSHSRMNKRDIPLAYMCREGIPPDVILYCTAPSGAVGALPGAVTVLLAQLPTQQMPKRL